MYTYSEPTMRLVCAVYKQVLILFPLFRIANNQIFWDPRAIGQGAGEGRSKQHVEPVLYCCVLSSSKKKKKKTYVRILDEIVCVCRHRAPVLRALIASPTGPPPPPPVNQFVLSFPTHRHTDSNFIHASLMFDLDFPFPEFREKKITIFLVLLLPLLLFVCELVSPPRRKVSRFNKTVWGFVI